jgi:hypothetical protein
LTFRLSDNLPNVCVVCGAPATGQSSVQVELPTDPDTKALSLIQMFAAVFGVLFFWWRESPGPPENCWLALPHCDGHASVDHVLSAVSVTAVSRYAVELDGAAAEFRDALETLNAPPSPELLAQLDTGPAADADSFLNDIDKSAVRNPDEFLKDLGRDDGGG